MQFPAFTVGGAEKSERQSNAAAGCCLPVCLLKASPAASGFSRFGLEVQPWAELWPMG